MLESHKSAIHKAGFDSNRVSQVRFECGVLVLGGGILAGNSLVLVPYDIELSITAVQVKQIENVQSPIIETSEQAWAQNA